MEIDKKNDKCCYNDVKHLYWNEENDKTYTSVTTLIGKFKTPFDSEFWASYKAFEKLYTGSKESAKEIKGALRKSKKFNLNLSEYGIDIDLFNDTKQEFLDAWEEEKVKSCERGTNIHLKKENEFYKAGKHELSKFGLGGKFDCKKDYYELDLEKGVYPEYLVYVESKDGFLMLAGQIDLLIKDGNDIYIIDYKTNKKIEEKSFFDSATRQNTKMLHPLTNIMDSNYWHYTLQLSIYAWMIQQKNPNFNIKGLILIHYDHAGNPPVTYELQYLKDDVIKLLKYFKRKNKVDYQTSLLKRIEF